METKSGSHSAGCREIGKHMTMTYTLSHPRNKIQALLMSREGAVFVVLILILLAQHQNLVV